MTQYSPHNHRIAYTAIKKHTQLIHIVTTHLHMTSNSKNQYYVLNSIVNNFSSIMTFCRPIRQPTGTTVTNPVISQKPRVARFPSTLCQFYGLRDIQRTKKKRIYWSESALQGAILCILTNQILISTKIDKASKRLYVYLNYLHTFQ